MPRAGFGWESLEKGMVILSILAWGIPWTEAWRGLQKIVLTEIGSAHTEFAFLLWFTLITELKEFCSNSIFKKLIILSHKNSFKC